MDEYDDYDGIFCDDEIVDYLLISEAIDDNSGCFGVILIGLMFFLL
jgi:hypothetical protein